MAALWRADLVLSARYHPIGLVVFLILVVTVIGSALYLVAPSTRPCLSRLSSIAGRPVVARIALAVLILTWLFRLGDLALHGGVFLW